jgi:hypothetical protein
LRFILRFRRDPKPDDEAQIDPGGHQRDLGPGIATRGANPPVLISGRRLEGTHNLRFLRMQKAERSAREGGKERKAETKPGQGRHEEGNVIRKRRHELMISNNKIKCANQGIDKPHKKERRERRSLGNPTVERGTT